MTNQDTAPGTQLELPLGKSSRGEIQVGKPEEDAPVNGERLMERVLEKGNLIRALRQVQRNGGSPGIDGMTVEELPTYLKEHWPAIREALLGGTYEPQPVKRGEIPKPDGGIRLLGVPTVLDRCIQQALLQVVQAEWDPTFSDASYGFRPGRSAHQALLRAQAYVHQGYAWVVDMDREKFFDRVNHDNLMSLVKERVSDRRVLKLIDRFLKAGVMIGEGWHPSMEGTPQGGPLSPILANVYLHYALDLWFQKVVKLRCCGEACLIRYADDFVAAFQYPEEADRFYQELGPRLGKFGLEVAPDKTRVIPFSHQHARGRTSFDFLGFEFRWGTDRAGKPHVKRRTARKKLRNSIKRFTAWCRDTCRSRVRDVFRDLNAKLRGYYRYYGVHGNSPSLQQFFNQAMRILFKWLNRRSQRRSYTWTGFTALLRHFRVERPRLVGRPNTRMAALEA